ncbi:MAG: endolytic transglycosylase MltG [Cellvibrionaceae bacterium]
MRFLIIIFLLAVVSVTAAGLYTYNWLDSPLSLHTVKDENNLDELSSAFVVKPGSSLTQVSNQLANQGYFKYPKILSVYGRLMKKTNIKVGEYSVLAIDTPKTLLGKFIDGDVIVYSVTLVEGKTFKEVLKHLQSQKKVRVELTDESQIDQFVSNLNIEEQHPEGWFFPDTYQYSLGVSDKTILRQAHQRMKDVLATEWEGRSENLPYKTPYEALIMASIVERETGQVSEREEIAGVFVRRLQKKMRLQTDPTIIYGLGDAYDGNIRRRHLSQKTPYNTYVINGLPPTPIALPGREAIYAALHPDDGKALYFVAKGDGSHQFSETLKDHNKAVLEYQINRRKKDYQSAPKK